VSAPSKQCAVADVKMSTSGSLKKALASVQQKQRALHPPIQS
jgi:hypothetical protein